jgi:hypothetical protein
MRSKGFAVLVAAAALAACASPAPQGASTSPQGAFTSPQGASKSPQGAPTTPQGSAAVPPQLVPAAGERAAFTWFARGVQIYRCETADGGAARWNFVAPEAQLYASAQSNAVVGSHGAGPFWQASDGSRIVGKVKARADAANAGGDIPWLLLTTTAEGPAGRMTPLASVQRIHTVGGVAPKTGCASAADVGQTARIPYTADYVYFTGAKP